MSKLLVATDIFGITDAVIEFCEQLDHDFICVSPYQGLHKHFEDETCAYTHFRNTTSVRDYKQRLAHKIAIEPCVKLLGFSVGASALWQLISEQSFDPKTDFLGFYGGQIRHASSLQPKISTRLIFPKSEPHFDVSELVEALKNKDNVEVTLTPFNHGFMNPYSDNFASDAYASTVELIRHWLNQ